MDKDSELEPALRFLEELERHHEPTLAAIRSHPLVTSVAEGNAPLEDLRRFAVAEYWYMRGGVRQFALSILNSPDVIGGGKVDHAGGRLLTNGD